MATLAFNRAEIAARELKPELLEMDGISRASVEAHYKLYQGYVAKRNEILAKLGEVDLAAANQVYSEIRALKVDLTFAIGGVKNHEVYFEHLGGGGGNPEGAIGELISRDFGSAEAWRADLKATGMAGRGWAWTAYDFDEQRLFNYVGDAQNTFPIWNAAPLVALDVYEHAYFLDYQTDRASYIEAFFGTSTGTSSTAGSPGTVSSHNRSRPHRGRLRPRQHAVGVLAPPAAPRRRHPHAWEREPGRDQRLADARVQVRDRGRAARHRQGRGCCAARPLARRRPRRGARRRRGDGRPLAPALPRLPARGKIVATTGGVALAIAPLAALAAAGVWLVVFLVFRYASVASIAAAISLPLWAFLFGASWPVMVFTAGAALAILVLHRTNIRRLRAGEEHRIQLRRPRLGGSSPPLRERSDGA